LQVKKVGETAAEKKLRQIQKNKEEDILPFGGRVLVFRRGYDEEVTRGRMLLPKIDYLQASLVQRSAGYVTDKIGQVERTVGSKVVRSGRSLQNKIREFVRLCMIEIFNTVPSEGKMGMSIRSALEGKIDDMSDKASSNLTSSSFKTENNTYPIEDVERGKTENKLFNLDRYGGNTKTQSADTASRYQDPLSPFLICQTNRDCGSNNAPSDSNGETAPPTRLVERVSVRDLVDLFSTLGRRRIVSSFFSKSELVEPTYEEVVLIWRPLPEKIKKKPQFVPPKVVYDIAEIFEVEDRLPQKPEPEPEPQPVPLKIRSFDGVPMANLPAVLPKTKLVFRPADAFVFDLVSVASFLALLGSVRFDSPKLDLISFVLGILWLLRTFFRYSNKLARYDLLVNKFLTSKISHRGPGALKYILAEAGSQKAIRAGLTYQWLLDRKQHERDGTTWLKEFLIREGSMGMNSLLDTDEHVFIDTEAALKDVENLGLIKSNDDTEAVEEVVTGQDASDALKKVWNDVFDGVNTSGKNL